MKRKKLVDEIKKKRSCLCIGLDSDVEKLPPQFSRNAEGVFNFNKEIIDATSDLCVSYKINTAFYESLGTAGWIAMENTVNYIPEDHFKIADAKRGDIGNTGGNYAKAFLMNLPFDAVTVSPYMGADSISPFLQYGGKWAIILGLTSNPGSEDFQKLHCENQLLWQKVLQTTSSYGNDENLMYVIGATRAEDLKSVRTIVPRHFLLIPGVGAQGGKVSDVMNAGMNEDIGLLINVSRSILFAGSGKDFAKAARSAALSFHNEMKEYI